MNNLHPLIQFAKEAGDQFDVKKFRDQLLMAIAVGVSVHYLKTWWIEFTEKKAK